MAKKTIIFDDYEKSNKKKSNKIGKGISKKMIGIIVAAVLVVAIAVTAIVAIVNEKKSYLATVNGVKISVTDFDSELSAIVSEYLEKAEADGVDVDDSVEVEKFWSSTNEDGITMRLAAKQEALQNMVEYSVQLLVAEEQGIVLTQQDKSNLIKEAESNAEYYANYYNQSYSTDYDAESFVEEYYGLSYSEYKEMYMESYILNQLTVMTQAKMSITDDEIQAWYDKDPATYDLYMVDSIYVSYQTTDDDKNTVMLEGDDLKAKQDAVAAIEAGLTAENFAEFAKDNKDATVTSNSLQLIDEKVSLTNSAANMEEVNTWLNETGLKDASKWTKIEVKGVSSGDFKETVVGVYFVKFDQKVDINTEDNADATEMRKEIKNEIYADKYEKQVEEWAANEKYEVVFNGDIYKNYNVAGYKAE